MSRWGNAGPRCSATVIARCEWTIALVAALALIRPGLLTAQDQAATDGRETRARASRQPLELLEDGLNAEMDRVVQLVREVALPRTSQSPEVRVGPVTSCNPALGNCGQGIQRLIQKVLARHGIPLAEAGHSAPIEISAQYNLLNGSQKFQMALMVANRQGEEREHVLVLRAEDVEPYRWSMLTEFLMASGSHVAPSAAPARGFELRVVITGPGRETRQPKAVGDKTFVELRRGEKFLVELVNHTSSDVVAQLYLDGVSAFEFSEDRQKYEFFLVPAGRSVEIPGWHLNPQRVNEFAVCEYADSAAAQTLQRDISNIGTITARFAAAWTEPAQQPPSEPAGKGSDVRLAVGSGKNVTADFCTTQRYISSRWETVSVCYDIPAPEEPPTPINSDNSQE